MSQYAIGLDLGGGSVRCLVLDLATRQITSAARSIASTPAPGTGGLGFYLDLAAASAALAAAAREAMARSGAGADEVAAIACSSMRLGTVLLDASGDVLLAVPNRDARAVGPGLKLAAEHGDALQQLAGHWPLPIFGAARLRWLKETGPDSFSRAAHFLSLSDWMGYLLCGEVATEPSHAVESLLFDVSAGEWSWEWIDRLELPRALFPEIRESGSRLGALTSAAAAHFGLRQGTPVVVGGADTQCGLLGAGAVQPGDVGVIAGTTAPVQIVLDEAVIDAEARVWSGRHVVKGRWVLESNAGPVGDALDWMGRVLYPDAPVSLGGTAMLLGEAAASPPGALGLLSSLGVQVMNAKQSALPVGQLTLTHMTSAGEATPRRHLTRAIVEGIACGLRANVEQTRTIGRTTADSRVYLAGGLSRSRFFAQVLADIAGEPVAVSPHPEATALGAALCAGVHAGRWPDLAAAGAQRSGEARVVSPDPDVAEASQDVYRRWQELRREQKAADAAASRLATPFVLSAQSAEAEEGGAAEAPDGTVEVDGQEIHEYRWLRPRAALDRQRDGDMKLAAPTFAITTRLAAYPSVDEALSAIASWPDEHLIGHIQEVPGGRVALYAQDVAYESGRLDEGGSRHRLWMVEGGWRYERDF